MLHNICRSFAYSQFHISLVFLDNPDLSQETTDQMAGQPHRKTVSGELEGH